MEWTEIGLHVPVESADSVSSLIWESLVNVSVTDGETDEKGMKSLTVYTEAEGQRVAEEIRRLLDSLWQEHTWQDYDLTVRQGEGTDWLYAWQEFFHPKKVSARFWAAPVGESVSVREGEEVIRIDPGASFGSGFHEQLACVFVSWKTLLNRDKSYTMSVRAPVFWLLQLPNAELLRCEPAITMSRL